VDREQAKLEITQLATARNETVVYRSAPPTEPNADQGYSQHPFTEQIEASDQLEDDVAPKRQRGGERQRGGSLQDAAARKLVESHLVEIHERAPLACERSQCR
jgi:hypothetical protein